MTTRRFPERRPLARPLGNTAQIIERRDTDRYLIQVGSALSGREIAQYSGGTRLVPGDHVVITWREESRNWDISGKLRDPATGGGPVLYVPLAGTDDGHFSSGASSLFNNSATGFVLGEGGTFQRHCFVRFPNIQLDQGDRVGRAIVTLINDDVQSASDHCTSIFCEDEDDAVAPTTNAEALALNLTTAFTTWEFNMNGQGAGSVVITADFTAAVQEVINRPGWVRGNALMMVIRTQSGCPAGTSNDSFRSFENGSNTPPQLSLSRATVTPTEGPWLDPVPRANSFQGPDDDEFDDLEIDSLFTELTVSGTAVWTEDRDVLSAVVAGQTINDVAAQLKPIGDFVQGDIIETVFRAFGPSSTQTVAGILLADGVVAGSNAIALCVFHRATTSVPQLVLLTGTLTALTTTLWSQDLHHALSLPWVHLRIEWSGLDSFTGEAGPNGVSWTSFGNGAQAFTFTPTHMGVFGSSWGDAGERIVSFEYFRAY